MKTARAVSLGTQTRVTRFLRARSNAKRIGALWRTLEATSESSARAGFSLNQFGGYWEDASVDELVQAYRAIVETETDPNERTAAAFSLASLLRSSLRLESARAVCNEVLSENPIRANFLRVLAEVEACSGNLREALRICDLIPTLPHGHSFRIAADELQRLAPMKQA